MIQFRQKNRVNEICNLTAKSSVTQSWSNELHYFETDFYAMKRLIDVILKSEMRYEQRISQISSTDMLGITKLSQPLRIGQPWSPYEESKLLAHFEAIRAREMGLY